MSMTASRTFTVGAGDADPSGLCRFSALQTYLQEVAADHAASLGASREDLVKTYRTVWMMVRLRCRLFRPLRYPETVTLSTWTFEPKGAIFTREFDIRVGDEPVGEASTAWVTADLDTRKIARPDRLKGQFVFRPSAEMRDIPLGKLRPIEPLAAAEPYTVRYSDLDINGHVNNVRYADFIANAIGADAMRGRYFSDIQINYAAECLPGDTLAFEIGGRDGLCYVRGRGGDGGVRFDAAAELRRAEG